MKPAAQPPAPPASSYSSLILALRTGRVGAAAVDDSSHTVRVTFHDGSKATVRVPASDTGLALRMVDAGVDVSVTQHRGALPVGGFLVGALLLVTIAFFMRAGTVGRRIAAPNRSSSRNDSVGALRTDVELALAPETRFADVAGCDEAVEELAEMVDFLTTPEKFEQVQARMPAGLLLTGPPGTGKTMLARALAGEAGVRFFSASGAEFVEKFVGVGASRIRDLFKRAIAAGPSVIFIDEIDAIGTARSAQETNGEREQTLNELLVQMDGFASSSHVVVVAATNRADVLDPALLRPGRFSRQISVGLPSEEGRRAILRVHAAAKPLADDVDLDTLARYTGGFSGAQLAELVNEGAIMAAREGRSEISQDDLREGLRRVIAGPKRRSAPIAEGEIEKIAYHEAGHVVCAELAEHHENAQHVTIDPRGRAMGFALFGQEDRALHDQDHLHDAMVAALGGRAAEQIVFGRVSSGAKNDLEKVNAIARAAVTEYGMSERLGQFVGDDRFLSNDTKVVIESEIEKMVAAAYADALAALDAHRPQLDALAKRLLDARELERVDIVTALAA